MEKQKGFTLIELIIVIVILGILSAYAIPKYYDFKKQANVAVINGAVGTITTAASLIRSAALIANNSTAPVTMADGTSVTLDSAGSSYPSVNSTGINASIDQSGLTFTSNATVASFTLATNCLVTYSISGNKAVITPVTGGC